MLVRAATAVIVRASHFRPARATNLAGFSGGRRAAEHAKRVAARRESPETAAARAFRLPSGTSLFENWREVHFG
jgi:hypothetical protein